MTDDELRDALREIDEGDADVSEWEAEFIESVVYRYDGPLSERQKAVAERIKAARPSFGTAWTD